MPASIKGGSQKTQDTRQVAAKPKVTRPKTVKLGVAGDGKSVAARSMTAFSKFSTPPPPSGSTSTGGSRTESVKSDLLPSAKGKGKQIVETFHDDALWIDKYQPQSEAELAVHIRKVEDVRRWFQEAFEGGPSGKLRKYRRILALTGPAGTGKTTTIRLLSESLGFEILEWKNGISDRPPTYDDAQSQDYSSIYDDYESNLNKFEAFMTRASSCNDLFQQNSAGPSKPSQTSKRRVVLLEDLPNILHSKTQAQFHDTLRALVNCTPSNPPVPLVLIISDTGMRGEARDERISEGRGMGSDKLQTLDIRTVLPRELIGGPYVTEIGFNPIAPTLLKKALQAMLSRHFSSATGSLSLQPSKEVLDMIVDSSNGDIRSAIMALQFACIVEIPGQKSKGPNTFVMEAVTRREQSLALFHLLGKVLYNKRKGDPPNSSASAKDLARERKLDALLKPPPPLPPHLKHHDRRASRLDIETLYADSPIDSSLFSLYIHQNYTPFCDEIEQVDGVADWLSWVDSSGGDMWYQANPYQFHLLTLGTIHSLPSPVPRRGQKYFKPEFFQHISKQNDALDAVRRTKDWLTDIGASTQNSGWRVGGWSKSAVALELGGILKARDLALPTFGSHSPEFNAPRSHRLFSHLPFVRGQDERLSQLNEGDVDANNGTGDCEMELDTARENKEEHEGGWLQSDDIEDFE